MLGVGPEGGVDPQLLPEMSPTIEGGAPGNPVWTGAGWWVHEGFLGCAEEKEVVVE